MNKKSHCPHSHAMTPTDYSRRKLLQFLAGSPLLAGSLGLPAIPAGAAQRLNDKDYIAESAQWAVNVFDMENVALRNWNQAHWTYISQGVDDELTLRANREGYERLHLRARRLIDVSTINRQTELFGHTLSSPIIMAPVGGLGMAHPDGDIEAAHGARASGHKMIMSTAATFGIEDITEARGEPVWYQLYPTDVWEITQGILRRVEATGSDVLFLTTDIPARNQDRMRRFDRSSDNCSECHIPGSTFADKAMLQGLNAPGNIRSSNPAMDWEWVKRLRDSTDMKLVIKGLTQPEDARLALRAGVDGIYVSNHGGRGDESGFATIDSLPEVADVVRGRIPVIVDGGIRRGTDVLKALALGADAVCVGRPYIWGLGAFGQEGVTKVMQILDSELEVAMTQAGTPTLADITAAAVR
ncbi:MAG: alpha-hydroxy-acid oxidizing protein [Gammaproteobacteria bacterium]|nr:alpha-hydroxy-acid oxidizing protein [Gammaproteobacteria bacterium]